MLERILQEFLTPVLLVVLVTNMSCAKLLYFGKHVIF